jgi:hypothetical protein
MVDPRLVDWAERTALAIENFMELSYPIADAAVGRNDEFAVDIYKLIDAGTKVAVELRSIASQQSSPPPPRQHLVLTSKQTLAPLAVPTRGWCLMLLILRTVRRLLELWIVILAFVWFGFLHF